MSSSPSPSRRSSVTAMHSRKPSASKVSRRPSASGTTSARSSASAASPSGPASFKRSREVFQEVFKILQHDSRYLDALKCAGTQVCDAFVTCTNDYVLPGSVVKSLKAENTLKKPTACICLALGAVNQWEDAMHVRWSTVGLAQLIVLIAVLDAFGIARSRTTISDPRFRTADIAYLKSLHFIASDKAFGTEASPDLPVLKEATLVYNPGCSIAQLYARNWSPAALSKFLTLQGTDRTLHQAVGKRVNFRISGQRARVTASTSQNVSPCFIAAIEEAVSESQEPSRRALSISQESPLPSIHSFVHDGITANNMAAHLGALDAETIQYAVRQTHTLCWASEKLLRQMPPAFWRLPAKAAKVSGAMNVDLEVDN